MISPKHRLLGAAATIALLVVLYVVGANAIASLRDEPSLVSQAQAACVQLAKPHLQSAPDATEVVFGDAPNVSSDPTHNAFEFKWSAAHNNLAGSSQGVGCRGLASKKVIVHLSVGNELIVSTERKY
jgi:hypothetical protein